MKGRIITYLPIGLLLTLIGCTFLGITQSEREKVFSYEHSHSDCGSNGCKIMNQERNLFRNYVIIKGEGSGNSPCSGIGHFPDDYIDAPEIQNKMQEIEDNILLKISSGNYEGNGQTDYNGYTYYYNWEGSLNENNVYDFQIKINVYEYKK